MASLGVDFPAHSLPSQATLMPCSQDLVAGSQLAAVENNFVRVENSGVEGDAERLITNDS